MKKLMIGLLAVVLLLGAGFVGGALTQTSGTQWLDAFGGRYMLEANNKLRVRGGAVTTSLVGVKNVVTPQGSLLANFLRLENKDGTLRVAIDSAGTFTVTNLVARIDSFPTTVATDTLAWAGATAGDVFTITEYLPAYSTTPDTGSSPYAFTIPTSGTVVVKRTKQTDASTLKSGAIYAIMKFDR